MDKQLLELAAMFSAVACALLFFYIKAAMPAIKFGIKKIRLSQKQKNCQHRPSPFSALGDAPGERFCTKCHANYFEPKAAREILNK